MDTNDELKHIGVARRSGRYPWGSGDDPQQRKKDFLGYYEKLKKEGLSDDTIAKGLGISSVEALKGRVLLYKYEQLKRKGLNDIEITEDLGLKSTGILRAKKSIANAAVRKENEGMALRLKDKGYSNTAIGERMGVNESTVRSWLNPAMKERNSTIQNTAYILKKNVEEKKYVDVGVGVERYMGVSRVKLKTAIELLKEEGYTVHYIEVTQAGTGKKTSVMTLAKPGTEYKEVYQNKGSIRNITEYSDNGGRSYLGLEPIRSIDSKRVQIRYSEDGGSGKDGVIELRRGVDELSLGQAKYAQVRIGVDGKYYMKGMAIYSDDLPPGIDVIYNTNKNKEVPKEEVFKKMEKDSNGNIDTDNPFGSTVRQQHHITEEGKKLKNSKEMLAMKQAGLTYEEISKNTKTPLSIVKKAIDVKALNIVNEEGSWGKWSKSISSQILSKQTPALAKKQLDLAYNVKKEEYDSIMALDNPTVRKKLLQTFSDDLDSSAVHLKAAALPRQASQVLIPIPSMKETEVYAPNYRDGEKVVLIRHPHGGIFEIPELTVNNRNREARKILGGAKDAVGINAKVAEQLSGADFDGDAVLVIPNNNREIKTKPTLEALKDFDPKISYKGYEGMPKMSDKRKQMEMGNISNLITDMTIRGGNANYDEIARAVKHSMVVIDAQKHNLNYKQSAIDNGIASLKKKYQGGSNKGASTLISRASSEERVNTRKESIDPNTGKKIYEYTNDSYVDKSGNTVYKKIKSTKMYEVEDAFELSSGTPMETIYATHANKLKALANESRKEMINTKPNPYSPEAKKKYEKEVASLNNKLNIALKNAPLERQAQILANVIIDSKKQNNPDMTKETLKKIKGQALAEARVRTRAKKTVIDITDAEWAAIQEGAVSPSALTKILDNADLDKVKMLATPRSSLTLSPAKEKLARLKLERGYTQAEVADSLGVSTSLINKLVN